MLYKTTQIDFIFDYKIVVIIIILTCVYPDMALELSVVTKGDVTMWAPELLWPLLGGWASSCRCSNFCSDARRPVALERIRGRYAKFFHL